MKVSRKKDKTRALYVALIAFVTAMVTSSSGFAAVTLPSVLADHMVLQRDKPVHIWGKADPAEKVQVSFRGHEGSAAADALGRWSVYLPPGDAGGPFPLTIQGKTASS